MPLRYSSVLPGVTLFLALAGTAIAADAESIQADEKTLRDASLPTEGPALLEFFRKRTLADVQREKIQALIRQMGDDSFQMRERAFADLLALGPAAAPLLRQAQNDTDIEVVRRSERCLQLIEKNYSSSIACAVARLVAIRKPEGSVEILLAYLPFADDETVVEEIRTALAATGFPGGKPDPALLKAVEDKAALRRAVAAEVLVRGGGDEQRTAMRKLLADADLSVRMRVALALIDRKDKDAIPVLIALLADAPREQCWRAEDILFRLGGDNSPTISLGTTDETRRKARDAWNEWWRKNGEALNLAKLDEAPRSLGHTLIVEMINGVNGRVREVGRDGKTRWQIENIQYPMDAQVVGPDRVLIVEYTARRITERDLKGNITWTKQIAAAASYPMTAQRMANGNVFIACRNQLIEVNREGKEVFTHNRPASDIMAAVKTRDGHSVFVTRTGQCVRLDAAGKEVKSFAIGLVQLIGANIDVLPNGRVLVPLSGNNKVAEYDADGKEVWSVNVNNPTSVMRLPNGNTLVGSMYNQQIFEFDRSGKEVSSSRSEGRLMRVRQR